MRGLFRLGRGSSAWVASVVCALGCGGPTLPGMLVGESAHFRLFIDPAFDSSSLPPSLQGGGALDALETDWADKRTMLNMPEGGSKIDYHLVAAGNLESACAGNSESGCELGDTLQIASTTLPHQHELIHAYMELAASAATPLPMLIEGAAQAIGCYGQTDGLTIGTRLAQDVPWQVVVTETASDSGADVYTQGGLFARYLIRTQGIDAFVRYYRQAPSRRDPALFATNFWNFWGMSIDDIWATMHVLAPGAAETDGPICPCSLPMPPADGRMVDGNRAVHPYWPLPDTGGASLAFTAPSGQAFAFAECDGVAPGFQSNASTVQATNPASASLTDISVAIVRPPSDGRRRYTITPISTASVGGYVAETCGGGVPYQLPGEFVSGWGELSILVDQASIGGVSEYVQVQVPGRGIANLGPAVDVCNSCAFGEGTCVPTSTPGGPYSPVQPGALNVRWRVPPSGQASAFPDPAGGWIQFTN